MLQIIYIIIISYLIGSIPTAYIFGRLIKKTDIRKFGSGNVGATNAFRLLGIKWGIVILLIDILKGFVPVFLLGDSASQCVSFAQSNNILIVIGLSSIAGHNWTVFLNFKGGKGVATTLGVLIALSFKIPGLGLALSLTIAVWLIFFLFFRLISLSSVVSALCFPILTLILRQDFLVIILSFILAIVIILRHLSNIKRLIAGKETPIRFKK